MSVLITGGTGWIGSHLIPHLTDPLVVSRNAESAKRKTGLPVDQIIECEIGSELIPSQRLSGVTSVVNLVGESIAEGRWTADKKKSLRDSRIQTTENLVNSLMQADTLPDVCVSASATGYYGERGDDVLVESDPAGKDFLSQICLDWEKATQPLVDAGVRVCHLRIGIVLGKGGGAMKTMLPPFRLGAGGRLGSGKQWMSWIHLDDLVQMILFLLNQSACTGPFNGTSPNPVRNNQFTKAMGAALGRPTFMFVPQTALRIAIGEFANFLFASQRVLPSAFENAGFTFQFPDIEPALADIVAP